MSVLVLSTLGWLDLLDSFLVLPLPSLAFCAAAWFAYCVLLYCFCCLFSLRLKEFVAIDNFDYSASLASCKKEDPDWIAIVEASTGGVC